MEKHELLTVSQFAQKAGISRQRVYKLLTSKLSTYCQRVDSQIMLDSSALSLFDVNGVDNETVNMLSSVDNETVNGLTTPTAAETAALDTLREIVNEQREQLVRLRSALDEEQARRSDAEQRAAAAEAQAQAIGAENARLSETVRGLTDAVRAHAAAIAAKEVQKQIETDAESAEPKKSGFFKRFFRKKP